MRSTLLLTAALLTLGVTGTAHAYQTPGEVFGEENIPHGEEAPGRTKDKPVIKGETKGETTISTESSPSESPSTGEEIFVEEQEPAFNPLAVPLRDTATGQEPLVLKKAVSSKSATKNAATTAATDDEGGSVLGLLAVIAIILAGAGAGVFAGMKILAKRGLKTA